MEPASEIEPPTYDSRNRSELEEDTTSNPSQNKEPDDLEEDCL
jgi:hypothetical protein